MAIQDFAKPAAGGDLNFEVGRILQHPDWLSPEQIADLYLTLHSLSEPPKLDGPLDMKAEIESQMRFVANLRRKVADENGNLREGMKPRDAKEIISASTTLFNTLMRAQDKVDQMMRLRKLEETVVAFLKLLPVDQHGQLLAQLEDELAKLA